MANENKIKYPSCVSKVRSINYEIHDCVVRTLLNITTNGNNEKSVLCIMMNPSKADKYQSDNSVNKVIKCFCDSYGFINIVNLFPFYETKSSKLSELINKLKKEPEFNEIIKFNLCTIKTKINSVNEIVLAWGDPANDEITQMHYGISMEILSYIAGKENIYVFGTTKFDTILTKKGNPRHPSRLDYSKIKKAKVEKEPIIYLNVYEDR